MIENMKVEYIKPRMEVAIAELASMLAVSEGATMLNVCNDEADEELANERRGPWGSLWGGE